ncbi:CDP-alcohol phosphatidyltransferase family protein [Gluconacetobacter diazotrophicus]|uniref:CDP-alcohol phosphatidyltransferase family protein n=1 Tax=Gluconacetobacter diazotrophicus TaxID=33996 RepID=A0A7W4FCP3_GLUDI|nr:CDP-alcohol phosphatidyltransferase family protein [Gluconacetobacter diazotrophicus]TWB07566.1 CDP-alcohol phosphatidyltransferase-like enzyme [Gluconacetobacter diazotrophicus]
MEQGPAIVDHPDPVRRTSEIEELTNLHVIHPISAWLTQRFARLGVAPNAVSLGGMLAGIMAGVAYHRDHDPRCAVAGFVLMVVWHVMDGADGQLARLTGKQSHTGKILDGICDYVTFIAVYTGLALALARDHGGWVWPVILLAGFCHAVQSAAYERQRQDYNFRGWGRGGSPLARSVARSGQRAGDLLFGLYNRIEAMTAGGDSRLDRRLSAMMAAHPDHVDAIRQHYRQAAAPLLRRWSILSANYRTIGIFLCVFLGVPMAYFYFEIIGLTLVLLLLLARQRACDRAILAELDSMACPSDAYRGELSLVADTVS